MSKDIDWSKAPEGAEFFGPETEGQWGCWYKKSVDFCEWLGWLEKDDDGWSKVAPYRGELIARPPQAWTGQGLPPVGTICEFYDESSSVDWREGLENGDKVKILAHYSPLGDGDMVAVFCYEIEGGKLTDQAVADCFRPIRPTPEQIAAEERENAVQKMIEDADYGGQRIREIFSRLYDAGYRKTEAGK